MKSTPYLDKIKSEHDALNLELTPLKAELAKTQAEHAATHEKQTRLRDAAGSMSMNTPLLVAQTAPIRRCAVYCRVSSDERLDQSFNSIDAQKEAGLAFIKSESHEG